ncbi:MAG: DUF3775 domain-containing protein [Verrucomicrobiae bacterium]|nr:DUF3775 domain-containing protein [Verrucomicrobiae bacterium]
MKQFHCPQEPEPDIRLPLTTLTFGNISQILTLLQHDPFESIERSIWISVKELSSAALEELCALIWIGRDNDEQDAWPSLVTEARGIDPWYVFEKISHPKYITNGIQRLGLTEAFTRYVLCKEALRPGIAA